MKIINDDIWPAMVPGDDGAVFVGCSERAEACGAPFAGEQTVERDSISREQIEAEVTALMEHAGSLAGYAAALVWDKKIIPDVIQELFLRYVRARIGGQQIENPRAWLFRVLRNHILDCNRKAACMPEVDLDAASRIADPHQSVEVLLSKNDALKRAFNSLSPREQDCIRFRIQGFGYAEIAQILGIRPGTVATLLSRSIKKFRRMGLLSEKKA